MKQRSYSPYSLPLKALLALGMAWALSNCASNPDVATNSSVSTPETSTPSNDEEGIEPRIVTVPDSEFSADTLYALLVAEMAIDRKRYDIALGNYVQQASGTQDLLVTARATRIARSLNARQSALEMSQLWLSIDPQSPEARYLASSELINANHLYEAFELSRQMLVEGEPTNFENIAMRAEKGDIYVVKELSKRFGDLLKTYKQDAGLWLGQSILLLQMGELDAALDTATAAKKLDENPIRSAFQETRVLYKMGKEDVARQRLAKLVKDNPENVGLRARYARLIWTTSPELAREQFQILYEQQPGDGEILFSLALVEKDLGELNDAQTHFEKLMEYQQYRNDAHYNLGEIHQVRNELDMALRHYGAVTHGKNHINALIKIAEVLQSMGKNEEAITFVKEQQEGAEDATSEALYMLEADLHSKAGQMSAAENALSQGISSFPTSTRLLYARAMLYSQIDYISAAEKDLKAVLELVPENAAALNALGYTLADRTERYQEAYEYIKQAYALTPDDPAVIDSMGWIAYRLGNYEEALEKLRLAMEALPDHEIAAHLGEVLWVTGNQEEAISVWKRGLEIDPKSEIIHKTLNRLNAELD